MSTTPSQDTTISRRNPLAHGELRQNALRISILLDKGHDPDQIAAILKISIDAVRYAKRRLEAETPTTPMIILEPSR